MARPTDWYHLDLHSDPTPGDPYEIRTQGNRFHTFAHDVAGVHRGLNAAAKDTVLSEANGKAMSAFRDKLGKLPAQLQKLYDSYQLAGDALIAYAGAVEMAQRDADSALAKARLLREELSHARTGLANATHAATQANAATAVRNTPPAGNVPQPDPDQVRQAARNAQYANSHQRALQSQVDNLHAQLAELKSKAESAGHSQERAADHLVGQLHEASNAGIHNKRWYQKLDEWAGKAWDLTVTLSKWVVALGGIILLFVGGPLVWIVAAAALIVLADTLVKFSQGKAGWGDVLFAVLDCIPVAGKFAMLAKAGRLAEGYGLAVKVARAEKQCATLIKVWHTGEDLKGFRKIGFVFAKGEAKDAAKDYLNGGWSQVKQNAASNAIGNAIGAGTGPLVDKGFSKVPGLVYRGDHTLLPNNVRRDYAELAMHMNGKTPMGKSVIGTTKSAITSVTKAVVSTAVFGQDFNMNDVLVNTAAGYGDTGLGYSTGVGPARAAFGR